MQASSKPTVVTGLVLRHLSINPLRPCGNSACQVVHLGEARLLQKSDGFRASSAHLAMGYYLALGIEFSDTLWKIAQRNKISAQVTDLIFVRLAHIENEDIGFRV